MKRLITALSAFAALTGAASALAVGTIPVAVYNFDNATDIASFQKLAGGGKCMTKVRTAGALGVNIDDASPSCVFRTSVIADSDDLSPRFQIQASASFDPRVTTKLRNKLYLSVVSRASATGAYELRIVPMKQRWMMIRDRDGAAGPEVLKSGKIKKIKPKPNKPVPLLLQTFESGTGVGIVAQVNGRTVYVATDFEANPPRGRYNGVAVGSKTGASGDGMLGTFDDITVSIPRNF
jgi:hypothetical protein